MDNVVQSGSTWAENFLRQITLFDRCSPQMLSKLAVNLRKHIYNKGDTILFQGIISNQLYLVATGMVSVFSRKDKVTRFIANLEKNAFFGEISLVKKCAATATIKAAVDETEIFTLDHDVINEILSQQPDVKADLDEKIRERNRHRLETFDQQKAEAAVASTVPAPAPSTNY
jgi:CRP/FNR family transcriptional regulator, cyclic AMP receptor protein